jgi:hypothetical protein
MDPNSRLHVSVKLSVLSITTSFLHRLDLESFDLRFQEPGQGLLGMHGKAVPMEDNS